MADEKPTNVLEALRAVSAKIDHIAKADSGKGITYKFRSIDRVLDACHDPFIEFGITVVPQVVTATSTPHTITSASGNTTVQLEAQILVNYRVFGPGGPSDFIDAQIFTTSMDPGDKATGKAMSYGYKNLMFQLLCLSAAAEEDNDQASARQASTQPRNAVTNDAAAVHPDWPAVGKRLVALKGAKPERYADCVAHFAKQGIFKSNPKGGYMPNHPLTLAQVDTALATVERAERDMVPEVQPPPVTVVVPDEPKASTATPEDVMAAHEATFGTHEHVPGNVSALLAAVKPKHSDYAHQIIEDAIGGEYDEADVDDKMWTLAETPPSLIDWKKTAKAFDIKFPELMQAAKNIAAAEKLPVPGRLDDEHMVAVAPFLRDHVLLGEYDKGAPFG